MNTILQDIDRGITRAWEELRDQRPSEQVFVHIHAPDEPYVTEFMTTVLARRPEVASVTDVGEDRAWPFPGVHGWRVVFHPRDVGPHDE